MSHLSFIHLLKKMVDSVDLTVKYVSFIKTSLLVEVDKKS